MTSNERFVEISAVIDGEAVDADALAAALEDPDGRAQLVDFVRLRNRVRALGGDEPGRLPARPSNTRTWIVRAAIVLLPLLLGAAGGIWFAEQRDSRPPQPDRVIEFVRGVDWK